MNTRRFCYIGGVRRFHEATSTVSYAQTEVETVPEVVTTPQVTLDTATNIEPNIHWDTAVHYTAAISTICYEPFWDLVDDKMQLYHALKSVVDAMVRSGVDSAGMLDPLLRQWHDHNGTSSVYLETGLDGIRIKQEDN